MISSYDAGARAGAAAWKQHKWCGGPDNRPIYFSLDTNATLDQYKAALQFMKGAGSAIGWDNVGMYGGLSQIDWAAQDGVKWLWQTYAWSYGQLSSHARIYQYRNGQTLGSGTVDFDRSVNNAVDLGQWNIEGTQDMPLTSDDIGKIRAAVQAELDEFSIKKFDTGALSLVELLGKYADPAGYAGFNRGPIGAALAMLKSDQPELADILRRVSITDEILAGVVALAQAVAELKLGAVDPATLAAKLSELLGPELAGAVAVELSARLARRAV